MTEEPGTEPRNGDEGISHCAYCGKEHLSESGRVIHCESCELPYCRGCCWETLPIAYKRKHRQRLHDDDFLDTVCDWCKWDVSWEDEDVAKSIAEDDARRRVSLDGGGRPRRTERRGCRICPNLEDSPERVIKVE